MLNNFIYAQTKELFLNALNNKQILDEAIVFIEDTKEIWNHGHYFGQDSQRFKELEDDLSDFIEQWNNSPASTISSSDITKWNKNIGTVTGVKINNGYTQSPVNGVVDLGYVNKQLSISTSSSMTLYPNVYYRNTNTSLSTLTITLFGGGVSSSIMNEYFVEFTTSSAGTTVSFPSNIKWANGEAPTFEASTTYQISMVNNLGTIQKFK